MDLIRRANWKFVSEREIISEDIYSLLLLYKDVQCVSVMSEALYFHCENEGSLTHTYREDRYERIKYFYDRCIFAASECRYGLNVRKRLAYPYISNTIAALKMITASDMSIQKKRMLNYGIVSEEHFLKVLNSTEYKGDSITRKIFLDLIKHRIFGVAYLLIRQRS